MAGMDHATAHEAFSRFRSDRSLRTAQIRFVEMIIDQLTSRRCMDAPALCETPFTRLHAGGPGELFAGKDAVIQRFVPDVESAGAARSGGTG